MENLNQDVKEDAYTDAMSYISNDLYSLHIFLDLVDMYHLSQDNEIIYNLYCINKYRFKRYSLYWLKLLEHVVYYMKKDFQKSFDKIIMLIEKEVFPTKSQLIRNIKEQVKLCNYDKTLSTKNIFENKFINEVKTKESTDLMDELFFNVLTLTKNDVTEFDKVEELPRNFIYFKNTKILLLEHIGSGGYSNVHKVLMNDQIFALKKLTRGNFQKEVSILERVKDCDWAIKIVDYELNVQHGYLDILMELGETDLQKYVLDNSISICFIRFAWESIIKIINNLHKLTWFPCTNHHAVLPNL